MKTCLSSGSLIAKKLVTNLLQWSLPSQQPHGGLRIQNGSSDDDDDDWKNEAMMHINLAGR
jgi:hypothetical protein